MLQASVYEEARSVRSVRSVCSVRLIRLIRLVRLVCSIRLMILALAYCMISLAELAFGFLRSCAYFEV